MSAARFHATCDLEISPSKVRSDKLAECTGPTLCPKVRVTSKPTLFSVNSEWILKSFDVLIAQCFRFDLVYDTWWLLHKGTWDSGLHFRQV